MDTLTTESLKGLQSTDERRLLDVVDKLRRVGLNGTLELPQLVVCGDQSSGKSSVLEAITEIPFPRKAGLCTRFATEIVLRRHPTNSATIKINPSKFRTADDVTKLSSFSKAITDLSTLPDIIDEATQVMGLGKVGESKAFSRDVLSVEICGPSRPQLTLVDLPGLIHSATKASTDADKDFIFGLVQEYMVNPRTIILAVVSAKNDAANQIILNLFKKIDKTGSRTLGIITKPDCISADDEQFWFDLMLNKEVFLERGWHMVKNRSEGETQLTFQDRNRAEQAFFDQGRFKTLPRQSIGIDSLRHRLSNLLLRHLVQELPSLKEEMSRKLRTTTIELARLGDKRETPQEQRMVLMRISMHINQIITAAVNGHYLHAFFESVDMGMPITAGKNVRRFRAVVQHLNHDFEENMRLRGHTYNLEDAYSESLSKPRSLLLQGVCERENSLLSEGCDTSGKETCRDFVDDLPVPTEMKHDQALKLVRNMIKRCRGHELPGSVNPEVTSHLFWEQSAPWQAIAERHIEVVQQMCRTFVQQVLEYCTPMELQKPLEEVVVNGVLEETLLQGREELKQLLIDKARHPSTYNHYYSDTLQKRRQDRHKEAVAKARNMATSKQDLGNGTQRTVVDQEKLQNEMAKIVERDMETFSAEEALESQRAYYKDELKYFVHAVTKQVIERCMIAPLPSRILSPVVVAAMTDEEVAFVAAEPSEMAAQRAFLEERKQMLDKGFEIFREAMGGLKRKVGVC